MKPDGRMLVTRTDRLGDVILSLPTLDSLRRSLPKASLTFVAKSIYLDLLKDFLAERKIDGQAPPTESGGRWKEVFERNRFDAGLFLYPERTLLFSAWRWRVPIRVGPVSHPLSFATLNFGARQRRSQGEMNEAEYNLKLSESLLQRASVSVAAPKPITLPVAQEEVGIVQRRLTQLGVEDGEPYAVFHVGMGGSALNLSARNYHALLQAVSKRYCNRILLTEGPSQADRRMVEELVRGIPSVAVVSGLTLRGLGELFRLSKVVFAPSTGPLHLAHYVGAATVGFYSPVQSHSRRRWEPWGGTGKSVVLQPDVDCPGKRDCLGKRCKLFLCMEAVPWEERALESLM